MELCQTASVVQLKNPNIADGMNRGHDIEISGYVKYFMDGADYNRPRVLWGVYNNIKRCEQNKIQRTEK